MFTEKKLEARVTLTAGTFSGGATQKIIRNLPMTVEITKAGLPARDSAKIKIWGISVDDMDAMTFLAFRTLQTVNNVIEVYAGDEENGMTLAYSGDITSSYPVFSSAPDVYFEIDALSAYYAALTPQEPTTFKGEIPVSSLLSTLASKAGFSYEDEAYSSMSAVNPVLTGSPIQQIMQIADEYKLDLVLSNNVLTWKGKGKRQILRVLSKDSGLFGYPSFSSQGLSFSSEYIPDARLKDWIRVESIVPRSTGIWQIEGISHSLGQLVDNAEWMTKIDSIWVDE